MIKVFTKEKDGKIHLTEKELKELLDEAYWEGYRANTHTWVYQTPNWSPYTWYSTTANATITPTTNSTLTTNSTVTADKITVSSNI